MNKFFIFFALFIIAFTSLVITCSEEPKESPIQELKSNLSRNLAPDVSQEDMATLVEGNTNFCFDLYNELKSSEVNEGKNLVFSPYSISAAMAMLYVGARGETETQIQEGMHYDLGQQDTHPAFNALDLELKSREENSIIKEDENLTLNIVNAFWQQSGYPVEPDYLDTLVLNYGAGIYTVDFQSDITNAIEAINEWGNINTNGMIPELLRDGDLDSNTVLVLTNAIYFHGDWLQKFGPNGTQNEDFYTLSGEVITTPTMYTNAGYDYLLDDDFDAVELPYIGKEISMVIIVPKEDKFTIVEDGLDYSMINSIIASLEFGNLFLYLPKFTIELGIDLNDIFFNLGMTNMFSSGANLSGLTPNSIYIEKIQQTAVIDVNENGTVAVAATAVIPVETPPEGYTFQINRPFIFILRDNITGTILFIGRVLDPTQ